MARIFTITAGIENMGALKSGGQGSIYKARRTGEIITAIKLLPTPVHSESNDDKNFIAFQNEVEKLKKVNEVPNPNVVKILSFGITETGSLPYIEMEFIEGPDLEELLKPPHENIFTIKETIRVAEQLSYALSHCHKVDVKHGDIKTNNVKYNVHSGNYVLLDFGLAIMSDEQRRTSMRYAGAIEFMAPEQSEGKMLLQTDIYSFGVILFELLAGSVPFPLNDSGESTRNRVMLAHMEKAPPDLLELRKKALPETWSTEKKEREMQIPDWIIRMIYKCLEKTPESRFADGMSLHHYIVNANHVGKNAETNNEANSLRQENRLLLAENEKLRKQLTSLGNQSNAKESNALPASAQPVFPRRGISNQSKYLYLFLLIALVGISALAYSFLKNKVPIANKARIAETEKEMPKRSIGQYKVFVPKAHFYTNPDLATKRSAYLIPSNDVITAFDEQGEFIYTEFTNSRAQTSKGWIRKKDLVTLEQWTANEKAQKPAPPPSSSDISSQLADARSLLDNNEVQAALYIFSYLSDLEIPEAMYEYGNLGLQKKNENLTCNQSYALIKKAADKGYGPAKRTLGFLFLFADNKEVLQINNYDQCSYERNAFKGSKLLMEAVLDGDSIAGKILNELEIEVNE